MSRRRLTLLAVLATFGLAGALPAQTSKSVRITGQVRDAEGHPLDGATVEVLGVKSHLLTDQTGSYSLDLDPGAYWISARRVGYLPAHLTARIEAGASRTIPITLDRVAQHLEDLTVSADERTIDRRLQDFYWRSKTAWGQFLTRDDLARQAGWDLISAVQRYLPGRSRWTLEQPSWFDPTPVSVASWASRGSISGSRGVDCAPAISIDGAQPWPGVSLADYSLDNVEAIEIYRRDSWVPLEFTTRQGNRCGLVVVWLK